MQLNSSEIKDLLTQHQDELDAIKQQLNEDI